MKSTTFIRLACLSAITLTIAGFTVITEMKSRTVGIEDLTLSSEVNTSAQHRLLIAHSGQDDQYNALNNYDRNGQYNANNQYSANDQYNAHNQYSANDQYNAHNQYSANDQYNANTQYNANNQYNAGGNAIEVEARFHSNYTFPLLMGEDFTKTLPSPKVACN